jgi:hypothetical protein
LRPGGTEIWDVMEPGKDNVFHGRIWSSGFILDLAQGGIGLDGFPEYWTRTEKKKPEPEEEAAPGSIGTVARQLLDLGTRGHHHLRRLIARATDRDTSKVGL